MQIEYTSKLDCYRQFRKHMYGFSDDIFRHKQTTGRCNIAVTSEQGDSDPGPQFTNRRTSYHQIS